MTEKVYLAQPSQMTHRIAMSLPVYLSAVLQMGTRESISRHIPTPSIACFLMYMSIVPAWHQILRLELLMVVVKS